MKKGNPKPPLPYGWTVHVSSTYPDRVFYYNTLTGCTTWELPIVQNLSQPSSTKNKSSHTKIECNAADQSSLIIDKLSPLDDAQLKRTVTEEAKPLKKKLPTKEALLSNSTLKPALKNCLKSVVDSEPKTANNVRFSRKRRCKIISPRSKSDCEPSTDDAIAADKAPFQEPRCPSEFIKTGEEKCMISPKHIFSKPAKMSPIPVTPYPSSRNMIAKHQANLVSQRKDQPRVYPKESYFPVQRESKVSKKCFIECGESSVVSPCESSVVEFPQHQKKQSQILPVSERVEVTSTASKMRITPEEPILPTSKSNILNLKSHQNLAKTESIVSDSIFVKKPIQSFSISKTHVKNPVEYDLLNNSTFSPNHPSGTNLSPPIRLRIRRKVPKSLNANHEFLESNSATNVMSISSQFQSGVNKNYDDELKSKKRHLSVSNTSTTALKVNFSESSLLPHGMQDFDKNVLASNEANSIETREEVEPMPKISRVESRAADILLSAIENPSTSIKAPISNVASECASSISNPTSALSSLTSRSFSPVFSMENRTTNQSQPMSITSDAFLSSKPHLLLQSNDLSFTKPPQQLDLTDLRMKLANKSISNSYSDSSAMVISSDFDQILFDTDTMKRNESSRPKLMNFNSDNSTSTLKKHITPSSSSISKSDSIFTSNITSVNDNNIVPSDPFELLLHKNVVNTSSVTKEPVVEQTLHINDKNTSLDGNQAQEQTGTKISGPKLHESNISHISGESAKQVSTTKTEQKMSEIVSSRAAILDWICSPVEYSPTGSAQSERSFGDFWAPKDKFSEVEESMDWEPTESGVLVTTSRTDILDDTYDGYEKYSWHIVVDTNVFIHDLEFLIELQDTLFKDRGLPIIVFPYIVFQELDALKEKCSKSKDNADKALAKKLRAAVNFINTNLCSEHPRFKGQSLQEHTQYEQMLKGVCNNDDKILHFCSALQKKGYQLTLLTEDKNLRNKALSSRIEAMSRNDLQKLSKVITIADVDMCATSPPEVAHCSKFSEDEQAEKIFCQAKMILHDVFKEVLHRGMQAEFKTMWSRLVARKPPWTLADIMFCIQKHWISVFSDKLPSNTLMLVKDVDEFLKKNKMKNRFDNTLCDVKNFIEISKQLVLCVAFHDAMKHKMKVAVAKLNVLSSMCEYGNKPLYNGCNFDSRNSNTSEPMENNTNTKTIENYEKSSNELQISKELQKPEEVPESEVATKENQLPFVERHLQALWEKLNSFCAKLENLETLDVHNSKHLDEVEQAIPSVHRLAKLFIQLNQKILQKKPGSNDEDIKELHEMLMSEYFEHYENDIFEEPFSVDSLACYYKENMKQMQLAQHQFEEFSKKLNNGVRFFMSR